MLENISNIPPFSILNHLEFGERFVGLLKGIMILVGVSCEISDHAD